MSVFSKRRPCVYFAPCTVYRLKHAMALFRLVYIRIDRPFYSLCPCEGFQGPGLPSTTEGIRRHSVQLQAVSLLACTPHTHAHTRTHTTHKHTHTHVHTHTQAHVHTRTHTHTHHTQAHAHTRTHTHTSTRTHTHTHVMILVCFYIFVFVTCMGDFKKCTKSQQILVHRGIGECVHMCQF